MQKLTADKAEVAEQQADVSRRERELQAAETAATEARGQLAEQQEKQRSLEQQLQVRDTPTPLYMHSGRGLWWSRTGA